LFSGASGVIHYIQAESFEGSMSESIFERITAFLSKKSAVQRVADDPALASELLLWCLPLATSILLK